MTVHGATPSPSATPHPPVNTREPSITSSLAGLWPLDGRATVPPNTPTGRCSGAWNMLEVPAHSPPGAALLPGLWFPTRGRETPRPVGATNTQPCVLPTENTPQHALQPVTRGAAWRRRGPGRAHPHGQAGAWSPGERGLERGTVSCTRRHLGRGAGRVRAGAAADGVHAHGVHASINQRGVRRLNSRRTRGRAAGWLQC